jgi:hypothetical protein
VLPHARPDTHDWCFWQLCDPKGCYHRLKEALWQNCFNILGPSAFIDWIIAVMYSCQLQDDSFLMRLTRDICKTVFAWMTNSASNALCLFWLHWGYLRIFQFLWGESLETDVWWIDIYIKTGTYLVSVSGFGAVFWAWHIPTEAWFGKSVGRTFSGTQPPDVWLLSYSKVKSKWQCFSQWCVS